MKRAAASIAVFAIFLSIITQGNSVAAPPTGATIQTFAGTGTTGLGADNVDPLRSALYLPMDVTVGPDGGIYIADWNNHRIRVVENGLVRTIIGDGILGDASPGYASDVHLDHPTHVAFDLSGDLIITVWHSSKVLRMDMTTQWVEPIVNFDGLRGFVGDGGPAIDAWLNLPSSAVFDADGRLHISDQQNVRIRQVDGNGIMHTVVGSGAAGYCGDGGPAIDACLDNPRGQNPYPGGKIAFDKENNLYIADTNNHAVRKVDTNGIITTVAGTGVMGYGGDDGAATAAQLNTPGDIAIGPNGHLYIADTYNHCARMVDGDGIITTVAGMGGVHGYAGDGGNATDAMLNQPFGIEVDASGRLYIADTFNSVVRVVEPPVVTAEMDIQPGKCPNTFRLNDFDGGRGGHHSRGADFRVAVLGAPDFDATEIDPETIRLEGATPSRTMLRDVGPVANGMWGRADNNGHHRDNHDDGHDGWHDDDDDADDPPDTLCPCADGHHARNGHGGDGITDLLALFHARDLADAIEPGVSGEERILTLTGSLNDGTPFEATDCIVFTGRGRWDRAGGGAGEDAGSLSSASLRGALPNPFNPVTRITFFLPETRTVRLNVYDVRGALIESLVDGRRGAGEHVVEWDAGHLPSGIYFYRLDAGGFTETRKAILLK